MVCVCVCVRAMAQTKDADRKRDTRPSDTLFVVNFDASRVRESDIERHFDSYGECLDDMDMRIVEAPACTSAGGLGGVRLSANCDRAKSDGCCHHVCVCVQVASSVWRLRR